MASSTHYVQEYQQALSFYTQGGYREAAAITDQLIENYPSDPNLRLLRGHIYYYLQQYKIARQQYHRVLELTSDPELLEYAHNGLDTTEQFDSSQAYENALKPITDSDQTHLAVDNKVETRDPIDSYFDNQGSSNSSRVDVEELSHFRNEPELVDPFGDGSNVAFREQEVSPNLEANPFGIEPALIDQEQARTYPSSFDAETTLFIGEVGSQDSSAAREGFELSRSSLEPVAQNDDLDLTLPSTEVAFEELSTKNTANPFSQAEGVNNQHASEAVLPPDFNELEHDWHSSSIEEEAKKKLVYPEQESGLLSVVIDDQSTLNPSNDLGEVSNLDFYENFPSYLGYEQKSVPNQQPTPLKENATNLSNLSSLVGSIAQARSFQPQDSLLPPAKNLSTDPTPIVHRGLLAPFINASLGTKQLLTAVLTGVVSAMTVVAVSQFSSEALPRQNDTVFSRLAETGLIALAAGISGSTTTFVLGQFTAKQLKRTAADLQAQFDAVACGNLAARAKVSSQDELGRLANSFNQMTHAIHITTTEAQRRAAEQEKAKEDLQRQVIRLLDDVEGAARGDLTIQAEVTADVLGAVADSFNLTIQNLQKLVQQVKIAARQVSKEAAENDVFARDLSADALRQAEELAVTLNSVQILTDSIQQVAENAREANKVAQYASKTALKGGESVERTVAGILQIRGTVAETTRKVKRLAESTQEINKIVGLISQIASRTNLLALNASIEAARAGDAGRGFAVVADEVRQLADRSAKASKEIEQIVLQIQSETGQVMTAMEEGTQQVIEGTRLAEQAKQSLEDIIQVSQQIDGLVGSITAVTVEQTDASRGMAQVMQAVELTAQETSQEAQRVSGSLQRLVEVAQELQASVERFKLESTEVRS